MAIVIKNIGKETEEDRMLNELFISPIRTGYLEVGEEKYVIPIYYEDFREQIDQLEVRDDDVWVTGFPRTGTTWLHKMVRLINSNLDYGSDLEFLPFFLDFSILHETKKIQVDFGMSGDYMQQLIEHKTSRCIKTHLPWSLLPEQIKSGAKKPKIIHIFRNPKDTCVSYYHNCQLMDGYIGDFDQFCRLFMSGRCNYGPFFATPLSYWREKQRSNLLLIHYKDLKKDLPGSIKTISKFLGKSFTNDQIAGLVKRMSFDTMQKADRKDNAFRNKFFKFYNLTRSENEFVRLGKEGAYKSVLSTEVIAKFDVWTKENLANTGLFFE